MKQTIDHIRLSKQSKDQLLNLKRQTGLPSLNILCRYAYLLSIKDSNPLPVNRQPSTGEGGFDISWGVFSGDFSLALSSMAKMNLASRKSTKSNTMDAQFIKAHIQRGLSYLSANKSIRSITDLISYSLKQ